MKLFILFFSLIVGLQPKDSVYALIRNEAISAGIDKTFLDKTFNHQDIKVHSKIKELFEKPFEKKSWAEYRKIFVTKKRVDSGAKFYSSQYNLLDSTST